jgi:hypothetical protein
MNAPNLNFEQAKSIVLLAVVLVILYFIWKIFLRDKTSEITQANKDISEMKGSDENYWKKKQKITIVAFGGKELARVTIEIHDAIHFFGVGIKDQKLMNAFYKIKSQRQLSQVKSYYLTKYKIDMMNDLATTLNDKIINRFASNDAYQKIATYLKTLPDALE